MSFIEKIKKLFSSESGKNQEIQEIKLEGLETETQKLFNLEEERINQIRERIRNRVFSLAEELKSSIQKLKRINLEEKRENEKIKHIVKENLNFYITYLEKLISEIENLDIDKDYIKSLTSRFDSFNKNSKNSFEKATILIGKELEEAKSSVRNFTSSFNSLLLDNKEIFERQKKLSKLKEEIRKFEQEKNVEEEIKDNLAKFGKKVQEQEKNRKDTNDKLETLKKSEEYNKFTEDNKNKEKEKISLDNQIMAIKKEINLKNLARHFHSDKKASSLVQSYLEDFKLSLEQDESLSIIKLIKEIAPEFKTEELEEIRRKTEELKEKETEIEKKIKETESELKKTESELEYVESELEKENEKEKRFKEKIEEMKEEIKAKASELSLKIV